MCPICLTTAALIAGSATSTSSLTAFIAKKVLSKNGNKKELLLLSATENHYGKKRDHKTCDRIASRMA